MRPGASVFNLPFPTSNGPALYELRSGASMEEFTVKDKVAVAGIGETKYYKRGKAPVPEFKLAVEAITKAAEDAGIAVIDIDGFSGYADDRNSAVRLAAALGLPQLRFANMMWGGGGGGGSGAVGNAAAAIVAGYAKYVCVFRALAQGQFGRFGQAPPVKTVSGPAAYTLPYGMAVPAHWVALRTRRFMHDHGINQDPLRAVAMADYYHAQFNPRAVMYGHLPRARSTTTRAGSPSRFIFMTAAWKTTAPPRLSSPAPSARAI